MDAESVYEAAAIALSWLTKDDWAEVVAPGMELEVESMRSTNLVLSIPCSGHRGSDEDGVRIRQRRSIRFTNPL
jgi:hypothetical protein